MPSVTSYLDIRGVLLPDMTYRAQSGFETDRPRMRAGRATCCGSHLADDVTAVALGEHDEPLVEVQVDLAMRGCCGIDPNIRRLRACLPLHSGAVAYELRCGTIRIYRANIAAQPPRISNLKTVKRGHHLSLTWRTTHAQPVTWGVVFESEDGAGRVTLARGLTAPALTIDFERTPLFGQGRIDVLATDGVRSAYLRGPRHDGVVRNALLHIASPHDGAVLPAGQPVSLAAVCLDPLGAATMPNRLAWLLDGHAVGDGRMLSAISGVASGQHVVEVICQLAGVELRDRRRFSIAHETAAEREWHTLMVELQSSTG